MRYDGSPKNYLEEVVTHFIDSLDRFNLSLCISNAEFYKAMRKIICQLYHYKEKPHNERYLDPIGELPKPHGWTIEQEQTWIDYMDYHYFDSDFWDAFWEFIPECHMDVTIRNWRTILTRRMPCYVTRASMGSDEECVDEDYEYEEEAEYDA
jgi:hypothetical protein